MMPNNLPRSRQSASDLLGLTELRWAEGHELFTGVEPDPRERLCPEAARVLRQGETASST